MTSFRVKVCGITRPGDGLMATEVGAELIGMIFYRRSPRFVQPHEAEAIISELPRAVARVGVFVDEPVQSLLELAVRLDLDYVQLHGNESDDQIDQVRREGFEVIKAFRILGLADWESLYSSSADLVMVDNATAELKGGTGRTFDWSIEPPRPVTNLVLSGGLTVDNIEDGVARFDPAIVDVNSGVESSPGVKSKAMLIEFMGKCDRIRNAK
ncbi:MAG: phosphoribosylanthranilate isomerase [candidate division Zixibacteria bacterium]|nr:phosphoribosylanthranilate isomerase [candidate division Zixibacteria bacterium]MDH3935798.1 phosphoribosylanthranilate isomerase [candidate division Zixibacteria bacterium]MDH4034634.1 phosphoribosylanthranilate isomerase [candidate division Zixibacteria bacterium]